LSVIPATQEVEVGGAWFEAILDKVNMRTYLKNKLKAKEKPGALANICNSVTQQAEIGRITVQGQLAQVVECLFGKCKALSSTLSTGNHINSL
jgi:hypothetical protein